MSDTQAAGADGQPSSGDRTATRSGGEGESIRPELLKLLVCPLGKAPLELAGDTLVCTRCGPAFRIEDGIPIMLIEEATLPPGVEGPEQLPCARDEDASSA